MHCALPSAAPKPIAPAHAGNSAIIARVEAVLTHRRAEVEAWLDAERQRCDTPIYSSVDVRHAGFKLAPVDTNLFPAGFNNLSAAAASRAATRMGGRFARMGYHKPRVLILPENHTRNVMYLENLHALAAIASKVASEVQIGTLQDVSEPLILTTASGATITQQPLARTGTTLHTRAGFLPDVILVNNDLTSGMPEMLRGVAQPMLPRPGQGWHRRRKSIHFEAYAQLAARFGQEFGIDPWLISAEFHKCGRVNFSERTGMECVALGVERVLSRIRTQYEAHGITQKPYVFVKSDSGTYGMGIMTVESGEDLLELNKKTRNKMATIKEGVENTEVIIQEGVPTVDTIEGNPAEPMMYLVDGHAVGGAYRVNRERDAMGNLNASGMYFMRLCDEGEADGEALALPPCSFGAFGLIAALATLSATREEYGEQYSI